MSQSEKLWFKRKLYGWGWTPSSWQGWVSLIVYVVLISLIVMSREEYISGNDMSGSNFVTFALPIFLLTTFFIILLFKKGEKPRWQWGKNKED